MKNIKIPTDLLPGTLHESNAYGSFTVTAYTNSRNIEIQFINTGTKHTTDQKAIRQGTVKDKFLPVVCGVGYLGNGIARNNKAAYRVWSNMLARCYAPNTHGYCRYGAVGVTVASEWHDFGNFIEWYNANHIEGYELDKDKLSGESKIYSPTTCCFISRQENTELAHAKAYALVSPEGEIITGTNMNNLCKKHGLNIGWLSMVVSGKAKQHKGWTKYNGETCTNA